MPDRPFTSPRAAYQIARILAALAGDGMTRERLCATLHLSTGTICYYLAHLMSEPRRVRIRGWMPTDGRAAPVYGLGSAKDAPEPPRKSKARKFMEMMADPVRHERHLARRRVKALAKRTAKKPQTWLSALM